MAHVEFSWRNQKSLGILFILYGWALSFQILPLIHGFEVLSVGNGLNDWMIIIGVIIATSTTAVAFMATIFENIFDPLVQSLENLHTVVLITFLVYIIGFFFGVPMFEAVEPFLTLEDKIVIEGWNYYLSSQVIGFILITTLWLFSEKYKR